MTEMPKGYKNATINSFFVNKTRQFAEGHLASMYPNIKFKICKKECANDSDDTFGKITLVVNEKDIVVIPPKLYEPDLKFGYHLHGKDYKTAVRTIQERIPKTKIVVRSGGAIIWQSKNEKEDYIQVELKNMKVDSLKFVRVPK